MRELLYPVGPGVAETVNMQHIKEHYYRSHDTINPTGVVPAGPVLILLDHMAVSDCCYITKPVERLLTRCSSVSL